MDDRGLMSLCRWKLFVRGLTLIGLGVLFAFTTGCGKGKPDKKVSAPTAQTEISGHAVAQGVIYPYYENGKWGFIDATGRIVKEPTYDFATASSEGLARIRISDRWGYVDSTAKVVIGPSHKRARPFSEGMAAVRVGGATYGYIDRSGRLVIQSFYPKTAGQFSEGLAAVPDRQNRWGYIDKTGQWVIPPQFVLAREFSNNRAVVRVGDQYGFVDRAGNMVIRADLAWADRFSNGVALVKVGTVKQSSFAFIDTTGAFVAMLQMDDVKGLSEGLARCKLNGQWGYVNAKGDFVIRPQYDNAADFSEGLAAVRVGPVWGYIESSNVMAVSPQFKVAGEFLGGVARVNYEGGWGYIDRSGKSIWKTTNAMPSEPES